MNWIPVDERTPPNEDTVLVYAPDVLLSTDYTLAFYKSGQWYSAHSLATRRNVTHWAALTPPKEIDSESVRFNS